MIQISSGQTFPFDDKLILDYPWEDLSIIKRFVLQYREKKLPDIELLFSSDSKPELNILILLNFVTECKLPEIGYRKLQFSQMLVEDYRHSQLENVNFRISDENFVEPVFLFKSGELHIT